MKILYDLNQDSGAMPVRWCLDELEQRRIVEEDITDLFVVIDIFYGRQPTESWYEATPKQRFVLPIDRYMQYIAFDRPGDAHVCVALVYPSERNENGAPDVAKMISRLNKLRDNGQYANHLFAFQNEPSGPAQTATRYSNYENECECIMVSFSHDVIEVPEGFFAKPFTGWLGWWVDWAPRELLRRNLVDQCDQRRWLIFAFTLQLILFPALMALSLVLNVILYLLTLVAASYFGIWRGYRGVGWSGVLKHEETPRSLRDAVRSEGWSSIYDRSEEGAPRALLNRFVQPAVLVLAFGIIDTMTRATSESVPILGFVCVVIGLVGCIPSIRSAIHDAFASSRIANQESARERNRREEAEAFALREAQRAAASERMRRLVADLSCPVVPAGAAVDVRPFLRIESIPAEQRTFRLRFDALKAKVCRPLAR